MHRAIYLHYSSKFHLSIVEMPGNVFLRTGISLLCFNFYFVEILISIMFLRVTKWLEISKYIHIYSVSIYIGNVDTHYIFEG